MNAERAPLGQGAYGRVLRATRRASGAPVAVKQLPLARAQPWTDVTAAFASVDDAAAFALDVARAPALVATVADAGGATVSRNVVALTPPKDMALPAADVAFAVADAASYGQ